MSNYTYRVDFGPATFNGTNFVEYDVRFGGGAGHQYQFNLHRTIGIYFSDGQTGSFGDWGGTGVDIISGWMEAEYTEPSAGANMNVTVSWSITGCTTNTGSKSFTTSPHLASQNVEIIYWRNSNTAGTGQVDNFSFDAGNDGFSAPVPEPSTFVLTALGLVGLGCVVLRRKHRRA